VSGGEEELRIRARSHHDAVPSRGLGIVHGAIGIADKGLHAERRVPTDRDANGDGNGAGRPHRCEQRLFQPAPELLGDAGGGGANSREENTEFVATQARERAREGAQAVAEDLGNSDQERVAGVVAEAVVDGLEVVEVGTTMARLPP
jgi:hypothetical protein